MRILNWSRVSEVVEVQDDWYEIDRIDTDEGCVTTYLAIESGAPVIYRFEFLYRAESERLSRGTP